MTHHTSVLRVLVYVNDHQIDVNKLLPIEVDAIADEIQKLWPPDLYYRVWFDVEKLIAHSDWWEVAFRVICYYIPGKEERCLFPEEHLNRVVKKHIPIHPAVNSYSQLAKGNVTVVHVI